MPEPPHSPSSSWALSHLKLRFFASVRRFLQTKTTLQKKSRTDVTVDKEVLLQVAAMVDTQVSEDDSSSALQRSVTRLHFGSFEEKEIAAVEIGRLAREDVKMRTLMAELGVIPALVGMVSSEVTRRRSLAVRALIELANGTYTNKALMVQAGIFLKLPRQRVDVLEGSTRNEFAELIMSLSSSANHTKFPLASSEVLPFLIGILEANSSYETKESCLGTLYNLSAMLENTGPLLSNGVVHTLLTLISVKQLSEKALATLGHLVVTLMGKKAMEDSLRVPDSLIEIMAWEDKPKCQELSAYI